MKQGQRAVARRLRRQAEWCGRLGSPLYEALLTNAANDVEQGGACWAVLEGHERDPPQSALALRLMGGVHRVTLEGRAPALARFYPSAGGTADAADAWPAFRETVTEHAAELRKLVNNPVQTNEVGRSAALLGGFLLVARETGLPLRVLEVGASAGLNLRFDRYFYSAGNAHWGDPDAPVRFVDAFAAGRPPFHVQVSVNERRGCDSYPLDPSSEGDQLTLASYLWADQMERFSLLRAALEVARRTPAPVERAHGPEWVHARLSQPWAGSATVIFHSIVIQYLEEEARSRMIATIASAGRDATESAPLAWLRMEPGGEEAEVRLTSWPGGDERLIARCGYHGRPVRWLA